MSRADELVIDEGVGPEFHTYVEREKVRTYDGDIVVGADLPDSTQSSIHQWELASGVDQILEPDGRHVRGQWCRRRRQAQSKIGEPLRRQRHAPAPESAIGRLR